MSEMKTVFDKQKLMNRQLKLSSIEERTLKIYSIVDYIRKHKEELYEAMYNDLGRHNIDIDAEWMMVKNEAKYAAKNLRKWLKKKKVKNSLMTKGCKSYYIYEPKGTVLILTPWNAPLAIPLVPLIGAIAAGNTCIIKPSEHSKHTSAYIKTMVDTLFQEDEVAVFLGDKEVAEELLSYPFDHIFYTGNTKIGQIVMRSAADHMSSISLELGGKNPVIVDESADIHNASRKIAWAKSANCGQACVAPDFVLVHESKEQELIDELSKSFDDMFVSNDGIIESNEYPWIINDTHHNRLVNVIEDAKSKNANIAYGGTYRTEGLYVQPTVISDIDDSMLIMKDEIFGPLVAIKTYKNPSEVVDYLATKDKPLSLYIYSKNKSNIDYFLKNTTSGNSVVNHNMIQAGINPELPFGGVNHSGMGRIVGFSTFESMCNKRSIVIQPLGVRDFSSVSFPPYTKLYKKMIDFLAK